MICKNQYEIGVSEVPENKRGVKKNHAKHVGGNALWKLSSRWGKVKGFSEKAEFDMVRLMNPKQVVVTMQQYVLGTRIDVRHHIEIGVFKCKIFSAMSK